MELIDQEEKEVFKNFIKKKNYCLITYLDIYCIHRRKMKQ